MAQTPWGQSQYQATLAPGITRYSTTSHGGIHLSKERQAQLPDWAKITTFLKTHEWWEEDEGWCVPFLAFLDEIRVYTAAGPDTRLAQNVEENIEIALRIAQRHLPTVYAGYMASQSIKPQ